MNSAWLSRLNEVGPVDNVPWEQYGDAQDSGSFVQIVRSNRGITGKQHGEPCVWLHPQEEVEARGEMFDFKDHHSGLLDGQFERADPPMGCVRLRAHANFVYSVAIGRAGEWVVSGSADNCIAVWDATEGFRMRLCIRAAHKDSVNSLACTYDRILSVADASDAKLWDIETGELLGRFDTKDFGWQWGCAFRCGGPPRPQSTNIEDLVRMWPGHNTVEEQHPASYTLNEIAEPFGGSSAAVIAVSGARGSLHLLDSQMKVVHQCIGHTATAYDVHATADFVVSCGDQTIRVWDWETGEQLLSLSRTDAKTVRVRCAFSTEYGEPILVIVGSGDKKVDHWMLALSSASAASSGSPFANIFTHRHHWRFNTPGTANGLAFHNEFVVAGVESTKTLVALPLNPVHEDVSDASPEAKPDAFTILAEQTHSYHIDVYGNMIVSGDRTNDVCVYNPDPPGAMATRGFGFVKSAAKA